MVNKRQSKKVIVWDEVEHIVTMFPNYWEAGFFVNRTAETVRRLLNGTRVCQTIDDKYRVFYYSHEKLAELNDIIVQYSDGNNT